MIERLEAMLKRRLTTNEARYVDWLQGLDRETIDTFRGLFEDVYRAEESGENE